MIINTYENSGRGDACLNLIEKSQDFEAFSRIVILPIPTTRDGIHLTGSDKTLSDIRDMSDSETLVVGYGIPDFTIEYFTRIGASVVDLAIDEKFLEENGRLTAEGVLGIILNTEKKAPEDLKIGVVGYGRIGKHLTKLLLSLGAQVRVYSENRDVCLSLCSYGVSARETSQDADLSGLNILINTAPAKIFKEEKIPENMRIIDLASGKNFSDALSVEKYPGLPAKMFPLTSGELVFRTVKEKVLTLGGKDR